MKVLFVLRHAKSSWKNASLADFDRPLNKRGKRDAHLMGQWMREQGLFPELILSSPAKRAKMTAEVVAEECGYEGEVLYDRELYAFDYEPYLQILSTLQDDLECVMIVGHNPSLEELIEALTGEYQRFPTAALAELQLLIDHWGEIEDHENGVLVNLWRPKELPQA